MTAQDLSRRYIAFREPTGEVLVCDVNSEGEWIGGTEARFESWMAHCQVGHPAPQQGAHCALRAVHWYHSSHQPLVQPEVNEERSDEWKEEHRSWCERWDVHPSHEWVGLYQWWCPGLSE